MISPGRDANGSGQQQTRELYIYTRTPDGDYTESLANSVHLACTDDNDTFQSLNRNYGLLFAEAAVDGNNVIQEKGLKHPHLFRTADGGFGIVAVRVDGRGEADNESRGQVLLWTSPDLVSFREHGLLTLHPDRFVKEAVCEYEGSEGVYVLHWQDQAGHFFVNRLLDPAKPQDISLAEPAEPFQTERSAVLPGSVPGNLLKVEASAGDAVRAAWTPVHNTEVRLPEQVKVSSREDLLAVRAIAVYSDGSEVSRPVEWDCGHIDFGVPGTHEIKGRIVPHTWPFPLATGYADPVILPWEGKYYFMATNDNKNDIGIFVREADTIGELFAPGFKETVILDLDEDKGLVQTFWAPEFHVIGGELYILFAVGGKQWGPQCHMMKLKRDGGIMNAKDWSEPERVKRADGSWLAEDGITLDMTYFRADGTSCVLWSYRKGIGTPLDTGSMVYIATIDESRPAVLTSEPVLLTRPLYGWENIQGTINNEGPYPLLTEDTVYITYSGGAATGYTYAVGLLAIPRGSDYLDAGAWTKAKTPVVSYYSLDGIYGPGHNSFFRDDDGTVWMMYHGEEQLVKHGTRCSAMHRVHFGQKGLPVFDVVNERDVKPENITCSVRIHVQA